MVEVCGKGDVPTATLPIRRASMRRCASYSLGASMRHGGRESLGL